jgi:hypothetical protein
MPSTNLAWVLSSTENVTITSGEISSWKSTNDTADFALDFVDHSPVVGTNLLNGFAPVRFENKRLTNKASAGYITNQSRTYALLVKNVALDNTITPDCLQYPFDETQQIGICANANNNAHWGIGHSIYGTVSESTVLSTDSSPHLLILTVQYESPYAASLYLDSQLIASGNLSMSSNSYITLGCDAGNGYRGIGTVDVYEMMAWSKILTTEEIDELIAYVNAKYATSIS